ncbi:MAG: aldehyde dehydrogenase family protein, partial [Burkholderiaceae bacterium]
MVDRYQDFHLQLLAGEWREGSGEASRSVTNPYSGETLATIRSATSADLDAAYRKAAEAQVEWANTPPSERAALMHRVVAIFDQRKDEIIDWLIREAGSTQLKAAIEWGSARAITLEAASMPSRSRGATL